MPTTLSLGERLGPYEVVAPLAAGGMGEVFRARDTRLGREVAVKILPSALSHDTDWLWRFEREAQAAGQLNHPNVLSVYDVGRHAGAPYLVSELLVGSTLRERIQSGPLPVRKAVEFASQIARGLAAAHDKGIVHRDLKPDNVFVTEDGFVKILDFGLAKQTPPVSLDEAPTQAKIETPQTQPGITLGTVGYMSPEQIRGHPTDARSDIFSLGVILYEMLTGQRPFQGDSAIEALSAILREDPPEIPVQNSAVPVALDRLIRRCLEKAPSERFQSARDLGFALETFSHPSSAPNTEAAPTTPIGAVSTRIIPSVRRRLLWLVAVVVGIAVLGAGALLVQRRLHARPSLTFRPLTFRVGRVTSARFCTDRPAVVYAASWIGAEKADANAAAPSNTPVYVADTLTSESRSLGIEAASVQGCAQGEVLVEIRRPEQVVLARVPLAGGAPRDLVAEPPESLRGADWDGSRLALVRAAAGRYRAELPPGHTVYESANWTGAVRIAPDGKRIAAVELAMEGAAIVVAEAGRTARKFPLTGGFLQGWDEVELAWSATSDEILYAADDGIHAVSSKTGSNRLVLAVPCCTRLWDASRTRGLLLSQGPASVGMMGCAPGDARERDLSWLDVSWATDLSADGRAVVFRDLKSIYLRRTDGSPAVRLGEGEGWSLSPDGRWVLAFSSPDLKLLPTAAGEARTLPRGTLAAYQAAWWLPDAKRIIIRGSEAGRPLRTFIQDVDHGPPRPLTPEGVVCLMWPIASPDSRWVAVYNLKRDSSMLLHPVEGGDSRPIRGLRSNDWPLRWGQDDHSLVVAEYGSNPFTLFRLDMATGERRVLREITPFDPHARIDVLIPTPDGMGYVYSYTWSVSTLFLGEGFR